MKEGWTYKKLGDFIQEYSVRDKGQGFPVYSVTNTRGFCQEFFGKNVASEDTSNYKVVPRGCFAYNPSRINVGSVAWQNQEDNVSVSPLYVVFSVSPELRQDYLLYFIKSNYAMTYINALARGAVRNNLRLSVLKSFDIPYASLSEQKKIVSELDLLCDVIEKQKSQVDELDKLAQSTFYDMFGDPVKNEREWEVRKLHEVSIIGTGSTPSRNNSLYYDGGTIPWIKTTEVQNCEIYDTEEKITLLAIQETNCKIYPIGTLLMAMYGQGKTRGQLAKLKIEAATNQACAAMVINSELANIDYMYQYLHLLYDEIRDMARGGNQPNLNLNLVRSIPIILPPLALQQEFAAKVEAIEQMKTKVRQSLKESEDLFNSRMDYYFN